MCVLLALLAAGPLASRASAASPADPRLYVVDGVRTSLQRSAVAATGAAIVEVDHASLVVTASASDVRKLRALRRYPVARRVTPKVRTSKGGLVARAAAFPAADSGYHTYQEVTDETALIGRHVPVARHPPEHRQDL